jgi:hypothetical protein
MAGRPIGSTHRLRLRDFISKDEVEALVIIAKEKAKTDPKMLQFLLEQVFGRAQQSVELGNTGDLPFIINVVKDDRPNNNTIPATNYPAPDTTASPAPAGTNS